MRKTTRSTAHSPPGHGAVRVAGRCFRGTLRWGTRPPKRARPGYRGRPFAQAGARVRAFHGHRRAARSQQGLASARGTGSGTPRLRARLGGQRCASPGSPRGGSWHKHRDRELLDRHSPPSRVAQAIPRLTMQPRGSALVFSPCKRSAPTVRALLGQQPELRRRLDRFLSTVLLCAQSFGPDMVPTPADAPAGRRHFERNINQSSAKPEAIPHGASAGASSLSAQATFQFAPGADDSASRWQSSNAAMMRGASGEADAAARRPIVKRQLAPTAPAAAPFATGGAPRTSTSRPEDERTSVRLVRRTDGDMMARIAARVASSVPPPTAGAADEGGRAAALGTSARLPSSRVHPATMKGYTGRLPAGTDTSKRDEMRLLPIV